MKILVSVVSVMLLCGNVFAIEVVKLTDKPANCSVHNFRNVIMSDGSKSESIYPRDSIKTKDLNIISSEKSVVKIWERESGVLGPECFEAKNWSRVSSVSPGDYKSVIAVANSDCSINRAHVTNINEPVAIFAFDVSIKPEVGTEHKPSSLEYFYYTVDGAEKYLKTLIPNQGLRKWGNLQRIDTACLSVNVTTSAADNIEFANIWFGSNHLISFMCEGKSNCLQKANNRMKELCDEYDFGGIKYKSCQISTVEDTTSFVVRPDPFDDYKEVSSKLITRTGVPGLNINVKCSSD